MYILVGTENLEVQSGSTDVVKWLTLQHVTERTPQRRRAKARLLKEWDVQVRHVYREQNRAANFIAKRGHPSPVQCMNQVDHPPVQCILHEDKMGLLVARCVVERSD